MNWLAFCLLNLARGREVVLASFSHCPPPLQLPLGPVWACSAEQDCGYPLAGRPAAQLHNAAKALLRDSAHNAHLNIPLNPWVGEDDKHQLRVQLRKLKPSELRTMIDLDGKLRVGSACVFDLNSLASESTDQHTAAIPPQALSVDSQRITFAPSTAQIALFGAGALAHQIAQLLCDTPFNVHWSAAISERQPQREAANLVNHEPVTQAPNWLPPRCHCLVITHDHALDFELSAALARAPHVRSVGVVGSHKKSAHLQTFLQSQALSTAQQAKIRCPIGGGNTDSLTLAAIAIAQELSTIASAH